MTLFFAWALLFYFFGVSLFGGIAIGAVILFLNYLLALWNSKLQEKLLIKKDIRLMYTTESINNIKTLKLNTLKGYFLSKILFSRLSEIHQVKLKAFVNSLESML
jgi:hypothetical protein